jgi:16S rRNA processing protein RimM
MSQRRQKAEARRNKQNKNSGSQPIREPEFVQVGFLHKAHGLKGEMIMSILTDFPDRIQVGTEVFLREGEYQPHKITGIRQHNRGKLVSFEGFTEREQLDFLRNAAVFIHKDNIPALEEGEFYLHQFIGLNVITDEGKELGKIGDIIETGANNVFVVWDQEGKEVLLPDIDEVIQNVDIEAQIVTVHILNGLIPE